MHTLRTALLAIATAAGGLFASVGHVAAARPTDGTTVEDYVDGMVQLPRLDLDALDARARLRRTGRRDGLSDGRQGRTRRPVSATRRSPVRRRTRCTAPPTPACSASAPFRGAVIIPLDGLAGFWSGNIWGRRSATPGDYAAGLVVAHEFAHHIVDELATQRGVARPVWKNNELIADCLAGASTWAMARDGLLEAGDVEEALALLELIGDYQVDSRSHHGTPAERVAAFRIGLYGPDPTPVSRRRGSARDMLRRVLVLTHGSGPHRNGSSAVSTIS